MTAKNTNRLLDAFAKAWSLRDIDGVMTCFSDNAVYDASVGPGPGTKAQGKTAIRALVMEMFAFDHDTTGSVSGLQIFDGGAVWRWTYTHADRSFDTGCDIFSIADGLITLKDAYRKVNS